MVLTEGGGGGLLSSEAPLYPCHGLLWTRVMVSVPVSWSPLYLCLGLLCTCVLVSSVPVSWSPLYVSWSPLYLCHGHLCTCIAYIGNVLRTSSSSSFSSSSPDAVPEGEAGKVCRPPPVWKLRAVIWFPFVGVSLLLSKDTVLSPLLVFVFSTVAL